MDTLDEILDYAEQRNWGLVEITPNDLGEDAQTMVLIDGDGVQMLISVGWGAAGFYADVRMYVEGRAVEPNFFSLDNNTVTVHAPYTDK